MRPEKSPLIMTQHMPRFLRSLILALLTTAGLSFAADPDFSGIWTLNESSSELSRTTPQPWIRMQVEHKDVEVRCVPVEQPHPDTKKANRVMLHFAVNGKETAHPIGDATGKSIAKWEGSALMINTIVNGPQRSYTQMDRWKMSRDGRVLTIRRQIVSLQGEVESTLVYEKP
jgi:hypothetical protein